MSADRPTAATEAVIDPDRHEAVLFDLDGVVTDTAAVHAAAWADTFDRFLDERPSADGEDDRPFTHDDYRRHVDGKPRHDGVADFLASRGIELPLGGPDDEEDAPTVHGVGARKNRRFRERLAADGVVVFDETVQLVRRLHRAGVATALFTSSRNADAVLERAGLGELFAVRVDGFVAHRLELAGKPAPDVVCEAARRLAVSPQRCVVVEDAVAGVEAGVRAGAALVVGVARGGDADDGSDDGDDGGLAAAGAHAVVPDLGSVAVAGSGRRISAVRSVSDDMEALARALDARPGAVFVDFDGTLSEIVDDPDRAVPVDGAREALAELARRWPVAVISGRDLADVRRRVAVEGLWYAGSHGMELSGPGREHHTYEGAGDAEQQMADAARRLERAVGDVPGIAVEAKRFAVAVHLRRVSADLHDGVEARARDVADGLGRVRVTGGRALVELRPDLEWDKGRALGWLLERLGAAPDTLAVYAGDDLTDEDALRAVAAHGVGIVVRHGELGDRRTAARLGADSPAELVRALRRLAGGG